MNCSGIRCRSLGVTSTPISYKLAFGTYEDALQMVGVTSEPRIAGTVVSAARIQMFAATVQDGNPSYWDVDFATRPGADWWHRLPC